MKPQLLSTLVVPISMALAPLTASGAPDSKLRVEYQWFVGHPDPSNPDGTSVELAPGTVVFAGSDLAAKLGDLHSAASAAKEADRDRTIAELKRTYRLARVDVPASLASVELKVGEPFVLESPAKALETECTLVAFDEEQASFKVEIREGGSILAAPTVAIPVRRGGRALLGSRDGEDAPYLFLMIRVPRGPGALEFHGRAPRAIHRVNPIFPPAARKDGSEARVVLKCTIGRDGRVRDLVAVSGGPQVFVDAALDAVEQWRYEPALDAEGKPIEVKTTVTLNFSTTRRISK